MYLSTFLTIAFGATSLALPGAPEVSRRQCKYYETISDPGFYASASISSSDFPDDPNYFENAILEWQPSSGTTCTLFGNFERGFPIRASGDTKLDVYRRSSSTTKSYIGSLAALPVGPDGTLEDIVSSPIAKFPCASDIVLEFQLAITEPGTNANIAFSNDAENGFFILAC